MGDILETHPLAGFDANGFEALHEGAVGVEFGRRFIAGLAEVAGANDHQRHRRVDAGYVDALDAIRRSARRKELAGLGAGRIGEGEMDRRGGAGNAIDSGVALVGDATDPASQCALR